MPPKKITILDINIDTTSLDQLIDTSISVIASRDSSIHFACANPHSAVTAKNDSEFLRALNDAEIVVADGTGIALVSRIACSSAAPRITGHDYFHKLLEKLNSNGAGKVYFFGSSEQVLTLIRKNLKALFPNLTIAGTLSPPFREWTDEENNVMIETINAANADVLWVGLTAPKQEKWVYNNRQKLNTPIIGSVGAVFDFIAGTHPRAPAWMSRYGLEWLYRFMREPKRLWRRNLVSTPKFIFYALYNHLFKGRNQL